MRWHHVRSDLRLLAYILAELLGVRKRQLLRILRKEAVRLLWGSWVKSLSKVLDGLLVEAT